MYSRILVPMDGSLFAAQALPYARALAGTLNSNVELFCAVPSLVDVMRSHDLRYDDGAIEDSRPGPTLEQWRDVHRRVRRAAEEEMEQWAEGLRAAGLSASVTVGEGEPSDAIAREAEAKENTLVVMTTHGQSGLRRMWMGSVTDKTIRSTTVPVLVVRCKDEEGRVPDEPLFRSVILPLDGSRLAEQAMPHAMAVAKALGAKVDVLMAVSSPSAHLPIRYPVPEAYPTDLNARAGEYAVGIVDSFRSAGIEADASTVEDDAASAITDLAEATPDSLVVMTTHGRSGFQRLMMGSVTDKVVRHSGRPVLVVRAKEQAAAQAA